MATGANPNPQQQVHWWNDVSDWLGVLIKGLPWAKVTTPMIPVIIGEYYIGEYLFRLHQLNIANKISDAFPTPNTFMTFFIATMIIIAVYLLLSIWHFRKNLRKIN